jgi:hypothetical protein
VSRFVYSSKVEPTGALSHCVIVGRLIVFFTLDISIFQSVETRQLLPSAFILYLPIRYSARFSAAYLLTCHAVRAARDRLRVRS